MSNLKLRVGALMASALLLSACAAPQSTRNVNDPLEGMNRAFHGVNKAVDTVALRPASQVYGAVVPSPVARGVDNFASNLGQPAAVVNNLLQWRIDNAGQNLMRFLVNSTVGIGGLFDPASAIGLTENDTNFGETLHVWGAGEGAYLELPLFGPSNGRDALGLAVDTVIDPLRFLEMTELQQQRRRQVALTDLVGDRSQNAVLIDGVLYESADSYIQLRDTYSQARRFQLGIDGPEALDDFGVNPLDDPFRTSPRQ